MKNRNLTQAMQSLFDTSIPVVHNGKIDAVESGNLGQRWRDHYSDPFGDKKRPEARAVAMDLGPRTRTVINRRKQT